MNARSADTQGIRGCEGRIEETHTRKEELGLTIATRCPAAGLPPQAESPPC